MLKFVAPNVLAYEKIITNFDRSHILRGCAGADIPDDLGCEIALQDASTPMDIHS